MQYSPEKIKTSLIERYFSSRGSWSFFILLFLYQFFFIFQGIDLLDDGFYATFYEQIFKNPQSVEFNFMYWLSGIIGGAYLHFFPVYGLLALRLGGVLVSMGTIVVVYNLLKKHIHTWHLKLGLLICTLLFNREPRDIFYDNLTALFFVIMVWFLWKGLEQRRLGLLFVAGIFLGLNTFVRLPNVLGFVIAVSIGYYGFLHQVKKVYLLKQLIFFAIGFLGAGLTIIAIMKLTVHYDIFMNCFALVREMSKNKQSTHNLKDLVFVFINQYLGAVMQALAFLGLTFLGASIANKLIHKYNNAGVVRSLGYAIWIFFIFLALREKWIDRNVLVILITGLSLVAACLIVIRLDDKALSLLAFMGAVMTLVSMFGSDTGIMVAGKYTLWIALPLATHYYFSLVRVDVKSAVVFRKAEGPSTSSDLFMATESQLRAIAHFFVYIVIIASVYYAFIYTWNDSANRTKMVYTVNNAFLKGIFTTQKKAAALNELLAESVKYVKKGDDVLAFDAMPLYYAMSETKPFVRNSWPWQYDKNTFEQQLKLAVYERKILPVVVCQKINPFNRNWPDTFDDDKNIDDSHHLDLDPVMNKFLLDNHYKMIWENIAFRIYLPY